MTDKPEMGNPKKREREEWESWQSEMKIFANLCNCGCNNGKSPQVLQVRFDSIPWGKSCPLLLVAIQNLIHINGCSADIRIETMKWHSTYFTQNIEGYYTHCYVKQIDGFLEWEFLKVTSGMRRWFQLSSSCKTCLV